LTSIRVGSETYSLQDSVSGATLNDLKRLQSQTKSEWLPGGVTPKSIQDMFVSLAEQSQAEGFDPIDLLSDMVFMDNLAGVIFLARRKAGEHLEVSEAGDVAFTDIEFIADEEDEDAAPLDVAAESSVAA
jgi:hypothetical protein